MRDPGTRPPGRAARRRSPRRVRPTGRGRAAGVGAESCGAAFRGGLLGRGPGRRQTRCRPHPGRASRAASGRRRRPPPRHRAARRGGAGSGTSRQGAGPSSSPGCSAGPPWTRAGGCASLGAKEAGYNPFGHRSGAVRVQETAHRRRGAGRRRLREGGERAAAGRAGGGGEPSATGCPRCTRGSSGRQGAPRCRIRRPADPRRRRRPPGCCCSPPSPGSVPTPLRGP